MSLDLNFLMPQHWFLSSWNQDQLLVHVSKARGGPKLTCAQAPPPSSGRVPHRAEIREPGANGRQHLLAAF